MTDGKRRAKVDAVTIREDGGFSVAVLASVGRAIGDEIRDFCE
jgi:hypothetical protein